MERKNNQAASFDALVLAGGGNRCLWQLGFMEAAGSSADIQPKVVAGVSAGACMACAIFSGRIRQTLDYILEAAARVPGNITWGNLFNSEPLFPHHRTYRTGLVRVLDQSALDQLRAGPEMRILMAIPPRWAGAKGGVMLGFALYTLEKQLRKPLHPAWPMRFGYKSLVAGLDSCRNPEDLVNLILASSSTPPLVPVMHINGHTVLDGGLVDNAPVAAIGPEEGHALVLLTRRYPPHLLEGHPNRTYVQPSRPVPVKKWDYTDPKAMRDTFELGLRDGEAFAKGR